MRGVAPCCNEHGIKELQEGRPGAGDVVATHQVSYEDRVSIGSEDAEEPVKKVMADQSIDRFGHRTQPEYIRSIEIYEDLVAAIQVQELRGMGRHPLQRCDTLRRAWGFSAGAPDLKYSDHHYFRDYPAFISNICKCGAILPKAL